MEDCGAAKTTRIGNQIVQVARCWLVEGHTGQHRAQVLDSDDNPIPYYFGESERDGAS